MSEIIKLAAVSQTGQTEVIDALLKMLEETRNSDIVGVAIAVVHADGSTASNFEVGENIATLIGSVEFLKSRLLKQMAGD